MMRLAFIGAGRMASAMVTGILRESLYSPDAIACTCGNDPSGPDLAAKTGIAYEADATQLVAKADCIVLACKPQQFAQLDSRLAEKSKGKLILSILAGTTLERLDSKFSQARNIVRAMPNTPGQIGAGVTAYASRNPLNSTDVAQVEGILGSLGQVVALDESQLDAVTAVSGSGPAYVYEFTAGLRAAAEKVGLAPKVADLLARQTVIGASQLMASSQLDPVELRDAVTSPGGTTEAALASFEENDLRGIIEVSVTAAVKRSAELAKA